MCKHRSAACLLHLRAAPFEAHNTKLSCAAVLQETALHVLQKGGLHRSKPEQQMQHATAARFQTAENMHKQQTAFRLQKAAVPAQATQRKQGTQERDLKLTVSAQKQSYWAASSAVQSSASHHRRAPPHDADWNSFALRAGCRRRRIGAADVQPAWRGYGTRKAMCASRAAQPADAAAEVHLRCRLLDQPCLTMMVVLCDIWEVAWRGLRVYCNDMNTQTATGGSLTCRHCFWHHCYAISLARHYIAAACHASQCSQFAGHSNHQSMQR